MSRTDNPDLAPDAVLATELGDPAERHAAQVAEMGGEPDDIDDYDASDLDDGSILPENWDPLSPAPATIPSDEVTEEEVTDEDEAVVEAEEPDTADAEEKEDPAEDAAEADDTEDEGDADSEPTQKGIPKRRFDEVNEEKKALRVENENLKAQIKAGQPPEEQEEPFDVRSGEREYMDFLLDGDTDSALAKREEIDAAKEAKWKSETTTATRTDLSQEAENSELVDLSREAEAMFDVFNPDHADYNQGMLNKVMVFYKGYESTGDLNRADSFIAALADVVDMYDLMPEGEEAAADLGKPPPKVDVKKKAKLAAGAHIPVGGEGAGSAEAGAAVPSIEDMTDEEMDALPEKTLARMRGDLG